QCDLQNEYHWCSPSRNIDWKDDTRWMLLLRLRWLRRRRLATRLGTIAVGRLYVRIEYEPLAANRGCQRLQLIIYVVVRLHRWIDLSSQVRHLHLQVANLKLHFRRQL